MPDGQVIATTLVQLASVAVAAFGAYRCIDLQRFGRDRRLTALAWFFGLFAIAVAFNAAWQWQYGDPRPLGGDFRFGGGGFGNGTGGRPPPPGGPGIFSPTGDERVNVLLVGHHVSMLASLVVAVAAFGRKRPVEASVVAAALLGFGTVGRLVPAMLALEAGLTLYLAARAFINHIERRSAGAVQAALGFGLFFAGHLLFYLSHQPGYARTGLGDVLGLVGIVLLVQLLPGKR